MNKIVLVITLSLVSAFTLLAQDDAGKLSLTINMSGLETSEGNIRIALTNEESKWMSDDILEGAISQIVDGKSVHVFKNLVPGVYAVSAFHDKNENEKLDTNFMGIPKEPYAFSNNARGKFGPAKWKNAKFEVADDLSIQINFKD